MSRISKRLFTCPSCGHEGEFKMYDSVNVTLDPTLKDKVLDGTIFDWVCPHCGETISIRYNLLYHDMDRRFQVYYSPDHCAETNETVNDLMTKFLGTRCLCRSVQTLNELREKIYIFEKELNDIAIEFSKVLMRYSKESPISEQSELRFEELLLDPADNSKGHLAFRQIIDQQPQKEMLLWDKTNYDKICNEIATNYKYKMEKFCDTIDEEWIMSRMV